MSFIRMRCNYGPEEYTRYIRFDCVDHNDEVTETKDDTEPSSNDLQMSNGLRFLVYDLEEDPFKIFLDVTINEAEELITRPELFSITVDYLSAIRKEGYRVAILKAGDSL